MQLDSRAIEKLLPHRYPFLFLDRVLEIVPKQRIVARKLVSGSDPILQGHFPGQPVLPGVVLVEAMAQAGVVLAAHSGMFDAETQICYFMGINDAKFRALVTPGDILDIHVEALRIGRIGKFEGKILCDGKEVASAKFTAIVEAKPPVESGQE